MSIEFSCPSCQQLVRTPAAAAGKRGKCPQCNAIIDIPATGNVQVGSPATQESSQQAPAPSSSSATALGTLEFQCLYCGQLNRAPARSAGKKGKCPNCNAIVHIPNRSGVWKQGTDSSVESGVITAAGPAELAPSIDRERGPWRTQANPAAKRPANPSHDTVSDFPDDARGRRRTSRGRADRDDDYSRSYGLPPHEDETVIPVDPLDDLSTVPDPLFGLPLKTGLPGKESSEVPVWAVPEADGGRRSFSDAARRGLSWEREPSLDSFGETLTVITSAPHDAFSTMRRRDGFANPLAFLVVSYVCGTFLLLIESLLGMVMVQLLQESGALGGGQRPVNWETFFVGFGVGSVSCLAAATFAAAIGGFLAAGVFHAALAVLGGAEAGFQTTYRVVAFGLGTVYMLLPIPLVGPLFAFVMQLVVLTYGFKHAHETTLGRAFLAAAVPALLMTGLVVLFLLISLPLALAMPTSTSP